MPRPKGLPKSGGRTKGTLNKRTAAVQSAMQQASVLLAAGTEGGFEGDAHALLTAVYKNSNLPLDLRLHAAKAAIRYEKSPVVPSPPPDMGRIASIAERIREARKRLNGEYGERNTLEAVQ